MTHRAFSVSSLLSLEQCPRSWVATRLEANRERESDPQRVGRACHAAAEAVTRAVVANTSRPLSEIAREAVIEYAHRVGLTSAAMLDALEVMDTATSPGSTVTWAVPAKWTARAEVELHLDAEFQRCSPAQGAYVGILDRVQWSTEDGSVEVWDWKTGRDWMSGKELVGDAQAQWYSFLTLAFFPGATKVTFRRVMLRLGYVARVDFVRDEPWSQRIRDRMARGRAARDEVAAAGPNAPERVGPWCGTCPRIAACASVASSRVPQIDADLPRGDRARRMLALFALASRLRDELAEDVQKNGPISLGDGSEWGLHGRAHKALRLPLEETIQKLREIGMDAAMADAAFRIDADDAAGVVRDALLALVPNRALRRAYADELLTTIERQVLDVRKETEL